MPRRASGEPGADRCADALAHFDDTTISTLHAFAQRVLAEFPVEAGLPPGFEVLDDIQAAIDFAERWARFLDRLYADPGVERALTVRRRARVPHGPARDARAAHPRRLGPARRPEPAGVARRSRRSTSRRCSPPLDAAIAFAPECSWPRPTSCSQHLDGDVAEFRDRLAAAGDDEAAALEVLAERPTALDDHQGQKGNWPDKPAVRRGARPPPTPRSTPTIGALTGPAVDQLLRAATEFVRASVDERRRAGRLEFHDLLVLARDLVRARPAPCAARSTSATTICCSTSSRTPTRCRSSSRCSSRPTIPTPGTKPWWECSVPPGRLFLVGDPKQSIYRFRRADIELYHRVRDYFGARLTLSTNFRSRPGVIEFVNSVFAALLGTGDRARRPGRVRRARAEPRPRPTAMRCADPITVVGGEHPEETDLAALRRLEAQELAALIHRVRAEGWPVARRDADGGEVHRAARYADIAVLLPTRADASRTSSRPSTTPRSRPGSRASRSCTPPRRCRSCSPSSPRSTIPPTRSRSSPRCARRRSRAATTSSPSSAPRAAVGLPRRRRRRSCRRRIPS